MEWNTAALFDEEFNKIAASMLLEHPSADKDAPSTLKALADDLNLDDLNLNEGWDDSAGAAEAVKRLMKKRFKKQHKTESNVTLEEWQEASRANMARAMAEAEKNYEMAKQRALRRQKAEYIVILREAEPRARAMVHEAILDSQCKYNLLIQRTVEVFEKRDQHALMQRAEAVHAARGKAIAETLARTEDRGVDPANTGVDIEKVAQLKVFTHHVKEQARVETAVTTLRALCNGRVRAAFATVRARASSEVFAKKVSFARLEEQRRLRGAQEVLASERSKMRSLEARIASTQSESRQTVRELTKLAQLRKKQSILTMQNAEALADILRDEKRKAAAAAVEQAGVFDHDLTQEIEQLKSTHAQNLAESKARSEERASQLVRMALERAHKEHRIVEQRVREDMDRERVQAEHALLQKLGGRQAAIRATQEIRRTQAVAPATRAALFQADLDDDLP